MDPSRREFMLYLFGAPQVLTGSDGKFRRFATYVLERSRVLGLRLTEMTVVRPTASAEDGPSVIRTYGLRRSFKRLEKELAAGGLNRIAFDSMQSHPEGDHVLENDLTADFGCIGKGDGIQAGIGMDVKHLTLWNVSHFLTLLNEFTLLCRDLFLVSYGLAGVFPVAIAPGCYVRGVPLKRPSLEWHMEDVEAWFDDGCRTCDRCLRNVYGWNLLSPEHLRLRVGTVSLREWIEANRSRGTLKRLTEDLTIWTFEEVLPGVEFLDWVSPPLRKVRAQLVDHGVFMWQAKGERFIGRVF